MDLDQLIKQEKKFNKQVKRLDYQINMFREDMKSYLIIIFSIMALDIILFIKYYYGF